MKTIKGKLLALLLIMVSVLVLASCKDKTYTLSFVSEQGNAPSAITVKKDEEINLRDSKYQLTAEGYVFKGWFFDAQKTNYAGVFNLDEDTTVYAKWAKVNTVTFNSNGGSTVEPIKVESGSTIEAPSQPTKQGFKFAGWYKEATFTNKFNFENTEINNDITLYAKWNAVYTVTYNTNGGNEIEPTSVEVGKTYTLPEDPVKEGFRFAGWYTDEALQNAYVSTGEIASNLTLFAKWIGNQYTVIYNANGGRGNLAQQAFVYGTAQALSNNAFTRVGYQFVGWALTAEGEKAYNNAESVSNLAKSGSVTLYAVWEKINYLVKFDVNFPEEAQAQEVANKYVKLGESVTLAAALQAIDHYTFAKWTIDKDHPMAENSFDASAELVLSEAYIEYAVNNVFTFYAVWEPKQYTITFDNNNGTGTMANQVFTYGVAQALTANAFENEGSFFVGWVDDDNNSYTDGQSIQVSKNITLHAQWHSAAYQISFNANGGEGTMNAQNLVVNELTNKANGTITSNSFTKVGHEFAGWALTADGEKAYDDNAAIELSESVTLYALWRKASYTIKFKTTQGTVNMEDLVLEFGDTTNLPDAVYERTGYKLVAWGEYGSTTILYVNKGEITINESTIDLFTNNVLELYALWNAERYTITLHANGGVGNDRVVEYVYDQYQNLPLNTFTRVGYRFIGWSTSATDNTVTYVDEANATFAQNTDLYAVWEMVTKKVVVLTTDGYQAGSTSNKLGEFTIMDTTNICEDEGKVGLNINELMTQANYTYNGLTLIGFYRNYQATNALTQSSIYTSSSETIYVYAYFALVFTVDNSALNKDNVVVNLYQEEGVKDSYDLFEYLPVLSTVNNKLVFYDNVNLGNARESVTIKVYAVNKTDDNVAVNSSGNRYTVTLDNDVQVSVLEFGQGTVQTGYVSLNILFNADHCEYDASDPANIKVSAKSSAYSIIEVVRSNGTHATYQVYTVPVISGISAPYFEEYATKNLSATGSRWLNKVLEAYHVGSANIYKLRLNIKDNDGDLLDDLSSASLVYSVKVGNAVLTQSDSSSITVGSKTYSGLVFADTDHEYLYILNVDDTDKGYLALQFTEFAVGQNVEVQISLNGAPDDNVKLSFNVNAGVNVESHAELKEYYADLSVTEINIHKTIRAELSADQYREKDGKLYVMNYEPDNQLYNAQQGRPTGDVYVRAVTDGNTINNNLVVNGNYFTIDGSGLPIIDDVDPDTGEALFPENHSAVNKNQPWGTDSEGNKIWIKNSQTSIFANLLAYADKNGSYDYELVEGGSILSHVDMSDTVFSRGVGAYSLLYRQHENSVTYNNLYIIGNTITPQVNYDQAAEYVKSEEELAGYNSGGYNGIMVRGCTVNTNNVVIDYANTGVNVSCDMATANCEDTYIFYSWGYSLYGWSSCTVNLTNCDFRYSGGACVHIDEHREEQGSYEVYDCMEGYKKGQTNERTLTINFDPSLTIDRNTQLVNWVVGNEVWFKLMGLDGLTSTLVASMNAIIHGFSGVQYSIVKSYNHLNDSDKAYSQGATDNPQMWNFAVMLRQGEFEYAQSQGLYGVFNLDIAGEKIKRMPVQKGASSYVTHTTNSLGALTLPVSPFSEVGLNGFMQPTVSQGNIGLFLFPVSPISNYVDSLNPIPELEGPVEANIAQIMGTAQGFDHALRPNIVNMIAGREVPAEQQVFNAWSAYALGIALRGIQDHAGNSTGYGYTEIGLDISGITGSIISYYYEGNLID